MFKKLCSIPVTLTTHELTYLKAMWGYDDEKHVPWYRSGGKRANAVRQSLKEKGFIFKPEDDGILQFTDFGREIMGGYVERLGL